MPFLCALIIISFGFSMDVVTIGGRVFSDSDFFNKYGQNEWNRSDAKQKERMLDDYIKREACAIQAESLGFLNDPSLAGYDDTSLLDILVFSGENRALRDVMVGGKWVVQEGVHPMAQWTRQEYARFCKGAFSEN